MKRRPFEYDSLGNIVESKSRRGHSLQYMTSTHLGQ